VRSAWVSGAIERGAKGFDEGAFGSVLGAIERGAIGSSFRYEGTVPVGAHNLGVWRDRVVRVQVRTSGDR